MATLKDKKILLAVTGSIAAYKIATLTRLLVKSGAQVRIIMTEAATKFITPLTLATLSKNEVHQEVSSGASWNNHVELGLWADLMVVAPLTATSMAKMANAICDSMVVAVYLSARCPIFFAPAMDLDMWAHPANQANLKKLISYGNHLIPVGIGELASGLSGAGRMAEPAQIVEVLAHHFQKGKDLQGKKVLITAGPTFEAIDPVRFIGNRSSGKMGLALAKDALRRGAEVCLILGPSRLDLSHPALNLVKVESADQMYAAAKQHFPAMDIAILAAAVSDYRPKEQALEKIKKKSENLILELVKNPDIAASLGQQKQKHQLLIGFALETNNEEANAIGKLKKKNFDFIVLNSLKDPGAGFNHDTNQITILSKDNKIKKFELKSKKSVASDILDEAIEWMNK
ncbi:MAG: bifunctional phosphopantothenoylcysteine decarboxylase/phosphopantothenate--cysteine ligase CoaBC [Saprospiraceae bacterium]|jgi:phosphopantothenoylcysteine decarboxylase/phosphopantothenate--cysteine ligase|nr:bifunctional phosphopantothenoylcysteine decarboxylase/phosphopantothenate--cysteine ligase CoaBC [Saprospiraceae bacterium]